MKFTSFSPGVYKFLIVTTTRMAFELLSFLQVVVAQRRKCFPVEDSSESTGEMNSAELKQKRLLKDG
jgi:hypothetical protein